MLTDTQLEAIWSRAGKAQDYTMCTIVERALDGDEACRRIAGASARNVPIYAEAVAAVGGWR